MKKILLPLLALAVCLAACTPAPESEAPAPATETAETALAAESAAENAFPVGHLRGNGHLNETDSAWYRIGNERMSDGTIRVHLLKLDYAATREEVLYTWEEPVLQVGGVIVQGDTVCVVADQVLYRIPLDGGEPKTLPLAEFLSAVAADEYSAYNFSFITEENTYRGKRLDLATGQITDLDLPALTWDVWPVGENRFLLCRLHTEVPLPGRENEGEAFSAILQNAVCEYDWYDPATGALEKIMEEPYYGAVQADGTKRQHLFLGLRDGRLYFSWTVPGEDGTLLDAGVESCTLQGQDWQPLAGLTQTPEWNSALCQPDGQLRWIVGNGGTDAQVFDLETGTFHEPVNFVSAWPDTFLADGRVLLQTGYEDAQGNYHITHALADAQDYLNGTAELTPVESEAAKTLF